MNTRIDRKHSASRLKCLLIFVVSLGLCSCGFHLRGSIELPPELSRIHVVGVSPYTEFGATLNQQLRANGIKIVDAKQSTATLRITRKIGGRRVLSVDEDGKVLEYELYSIVSFEVKEKDKAILLANQTINLIRVLRYDINDVLGSAEEEKLLREDMEKDLVRLMIYRLQGISKV